MLSLLVAAATDAVNRIQPYEYAWIAAGAVVMVFVAQRVWSSGGSAQQTEHYSRPELAIAIVLGGLFLLGGVHAFTTPPVEDKQELSFQGIILTVALFIFMVMMMATLLSAAGRDLHFTFGLRRIPAWKAVLIGILLGVAAAPLADIAALATQKIAKSTDDVQGIVRLFQTGSVQDRWAIVVSAAIFAPVAEEMLFRGVIYGVAKRYGGMFAALIFNAAFFAFVHGHLPAIGGLFVLAICLTLAYEYSGSLYVPIAMHATFNALNLVEMALLPPGSKG